MATEAGTHQAQHLTAEHMIVQWRRAWERLPRTMPRAAKVSATRSQWTVLYAHLRGHLVQRHGVDRRLFSPATQRRLTVEAAIKLHDELHMATADE